MAVRRERLVDVYELRDGDSMVRRGSQTVTACLSRVCPRQAALESLGRVQGLGLEVAKCLEAGHVGKALWDQDRDPLVRAAACKAMALLEEGAFPSCLPRLWLILGPQV